MDGILITQDLTYVPSETYESILAVAYPLSQGVELDVMFPQYAKEQNAPTESFALENEDTKVIFYKVPTSKGQVIQNEIYSKADGNWILTKNRAEELGYLIIRADSAAPALPTQDLYAFQTTFTLGDVPSTYLGEELFKAGIPHFMIPTDVAVNGNQATLSFADDYADFSVVWTLEADNKAPLVDVQVTFKQDGVYTIGAWEGSEMMADDYAFALAPYRVQGKRVHEKAGLISEMHLFTPMGTYTLPEQNDYANGYNITKGVVAESSWIPQRWVRKNNGMFGINMKGPSNNYRGAIFAPVLGAENSNFQAGDSYNLQYRVISTVGDWFETYKFIANDLFDVHDYRQNVYGTLNDAIFNTRKLMMDDVYGGWDVYDKAHYNMEGKNITSSANPMEALQVYLLTEDVSVLTNRAIPTIANTLTREGLHFNRTTEAGGSEYFSTPSEGLPYSIGTPISGFNLNVIGGMYEMTRGGVPYLYEYGLEKGKSSVTNSYGSIAPFANHLYLYKYTGDESYLQQAIKGADAYLEKVVYTPQTNMIDWSSFIYISYYPNVASLMDIYEFTKDQKYLDAAKTAAQWLATTLWVPGIDGDKDTSEIEVNDLEEMKEWFHYGQEDHPNFWWHGDEQLRIGKPSNDPGNTQSDQNIIDQNENIAGWIPSRVGLGLEQASTFGNSSNIIMSSWVGDFLRLAEYTGETYFADAARNAMIGRFTNYSGYYQNGFTTYQQKPDYPYEGPDYTGIYWHHIPPFLAMLEDFLINLADTWSGGNIKFPGLRQQGYAYFNSMQYGYAPGQFFDEAAMWLWLDEGIVDAGHLQIDWLAAKKDGTLGIALMNESDEDVTTTIALGEKVEGGSAFTGTGILQDKNGTKQEVLFENGKATVTIPAKSLKAITIKIEAVKAPAFAQMTYTLDGTAKVKHTVSDHGNGKGYALQMHPDFYYAYVYITDRPQDTKNLKMTYLTGGEETTVETDVYPFEFIINEIPSDRDFTYTLEITKADGSIVKTDAKTLQPVFKK